MGLTWTDLQNRDDRIRLAMLSQGSWYSQHYAQYLQLAWNIEGVLIRIRPRNTINAQTTII